MGVTDLWKVLEPTRSSCSITDLKGQTLAIDLSGWIVESQSLVSPGQQRIAKPHLKNLFYRACHMLKNGIRPVFVMDGSMAPTLKQGTLERRRELRRFASPPRSKTHETNNATPSTPTRPSQTTQQAQMSTPRGNKSFQRTVQECCELLDMMGIPYMHAEGEADAMCALLNKQGLVDGVVTNDGDALVYGAQVVFKNFTCDEKKSEPMDMYKMIDIEDKLRLDQKKLVALSLLLGCDFYDGVKKIGKETAVQFLKMKHDQDVLERMKEWISNKEKFEDLEKSIPKKKGHCTHCGHQGALKQHKSNGCGMCKTKSNCLYSAPEDTKFCDCDWHSHPEYRYLVAEVKIRKQALLQQDFPPQQVIDTFLKPAAASAEVPIVWKEPRVEDLKSLLREKLYFTEDRANQHLVPFIASYVLSDWREASHTDHLQPVRIVKARTKNFKPVYEVQWEVKGQLQKLGESDQPHTTMEDQVTFRSTFPDMVAKFEEEEDHTMSQRKSRSRKRLAMPDASQQKISDIFKSKRSTTDTPRSGKKAASAASTPLEHPLSHSTPASKHDTKLIIKEVASSLETSSSGKSTPTISPARSPSWTKGRFSRSCSFTSTTSRSRSRSPRLGTVTPESRSSSRTSTPSRGSGSGKKRTPIRSRPYLPKEFAQRVIRVDKRTKFRKRVSKDKGEGFDKIRKKLFPEPSSIRKRLNFGGADRSAMDESLEVEMCGLPKSDDEDDDLGVAPLPDTSFSRRSHRNDKIATSAFYGSPDRLSSRLSRSASTASMSSIDLTCQESLDGESPRKRRSSRTPRKETIPVIVLDDSPAKKKSSPAKTSRKGTPVKSKDNTPAARSTISSAPAMKRAAVSTSSSVDLTDEERPPPSKKHIKESSVSSKAKASAKSKNTAKKSSGMKKSAKKRLLMGDEKTPSVKKFFTSLRT